MPQWDAPTQEQVENIIMEALGKHGYKWGSYKMHREELFSDKTEIVFYTYDQPITGFRVGVNIIP